MKEYSQLLRSWLIVRPKPATLRLTSATGTVSIVDCSNGMSWADLARSVEAMLPELVEALTADGRIVRAVRPQEMGDDEEPEAAPAAALPMSDAETTRFTLVANLLANAHKNSFDALVAITQSNQARAEAAERTVQAELKMRRLELLDKEDELREREEEIKAAQDPLTELAGAFMGGQAKAAATPPRPAAKPNGKA